MYSTILKEMALCAGKEVGKKALSKFSIISVSLISGTALGVLADRAIRHSESPEDKEARRKKKETAQAEKEAKKRAKEASNLNDLLSRLHKTEEQLKSRIDKLKEESDIVEDEIVSESVVEDEKATEPTEIPITEDPVDGGEGI